MSDGMNKVILLGNLGGDPELRYTAAGVAVLSMRLATNERFVDKNREVQERTEWHTVVVWGNRAEALARLLVKGQGLLVEGGLRTSSYEKDGQKRYKTEVHARDVVITGKRANGAPVEGANGGVPFVPPRPAEPVDELPY
jgi:single-strand DNA-binding protein